MSTGGGSAGRVLLRPGVRFNGVKVFSATMYMDRDALGDRVTSWIAAHPECKLTEIVVAQSSDSEFHCISISVFYRS